MNRYFLYCNENRQSDFQYMVIAASFESPLTEYDKIEKDLKSLHFKGNVLFDMFAYSGDSSERFFYIFFNKNNFDFTTLKYMDFPKNSLYRKYTQQILKNNCSILDTTVLNHIQKNMILHDFHI